MHFIYGLKSSANSAIMYVGKATEPALRLCLHLEKDSRLSNESAKERWIDSVHADGNKLQMVIIDSCEDSHDWQDLEAAWIRYFKGINQDLTNAILPYCKNPLKMNTEFSIDDTMVITEGDARQVSRYFYLRNNPMLTSKKVKSRLVENEYTYHVYRQRKLLLEGA